MWKREAGRIRGETKELVRNECNDSSEVIDQLLYCWGSTWHGYIKELCEFYLNLEMFQVVELGVIFVNASEQYV